MKPVRGNAILRAGALVVPALLSASALAQAHPDEALIKRGEYLARAGDCVACHTTPEGKSMGGGLALPTPIGDIISTNITPSKSHGIGSYTFEQFAEALRRGIRADGARLYPAMPYTSYALVTDDDARALYAYFMNAVEAVDSTPAQTHLPFPFNIRLSLAAWNLLYLDPNPFAPDPQRNAEWNRGAYLARGLAHCGACHTPRNLLMAEKPSQEFGGGHIGPWYAPNVTADADSGIGAWSAAELAAYMKAGHAQNKGGAAGPMAEAVDNSLRFLADADLQAIGAFLKSTRGIHDQADNRPPFSWGSAAAEPPALRGVALSSDPASWTGSQLYDGYCASCHQARGEGSFDGGLPPLIHNTSVGRIDTNNLVMVILQGVQRQPDVFMPPFGKALSNAQVAALGSFVTTQYGNPQARISADQVETLRDGGKKSVLLPAVRIAMAIGALVVLSAALMLLRRRRKSPARP